VEKEKEDKEEKEEPVEEEKYYHPFVQAMVYLESFDA
jgi:hypothetical protein